MRNLKNALKILAGGVLLLAVPSPVFAAPPRLDFDMLVKVLSNTLTVLMGIGGAAAVAMLVYGGISYIMSSGDKQAVETAKRTVTYAIMGLVLVIGAILIIQTAANWIGRGI
jgi:hypothetical protein